MRERRSVPTGVCYVISLSKCTSAAGGTPADQPAGTPALQPHFGADAQLQRVHLAAVGFVIVAEGVEEAVED